MTTSAAEVEPGGTPTARAIEAVRDQLAASNRRLHAVVASAPLAILGCELDGTLTFAGGQALQRLGLDPSELLGRTAWEIFDETRPDLTSRARAALAGADERLTTDWGDEVVDLWLRPLRDDSGQIVGGIAIATIVTERARLQRRTEVLAELGQDALRGLDFRTLCDRCCELLDVSDMGDPTVYLDDGHADGYLVLAGRGWATPHVGHLRAGREADSPVSYVVGSPEPVRSDDIYADPRWRPPRDPAKVQLRSFMAVRIESRSGVIGVLGAGRPDVDPYSDRDAGFLTGMANVLGAAYDAERAADELRHNALHDALTGLPNRALLSDRLESALQQAAKRDRRVGVIVCDLDRFKLVNDSHGHRAGDDLLTQVAGRLSQAVRPGDTVARFGGDEFVVVCADVDDEGDVVRVAERLAAVLTDPLTVGDHRIFATASMGIAIGDRDSDALDLLRDADSAMYRAKDEGRDRWEVFDDVLRARARLRLDTETALRHALDRDELLLHYQPIVDVSSGSMLGVEALVRWQHPERGLLGPDEFIPIAEDSGLIRAIGDWVLQRAAEQTAAWTTAGLWEHRATSINIAAAQIDEQLPARVAEVAAAVGLSPARLRVEITETVLLRDTAAAERVLRGLRDIGVRASVDDFGTGYSSLAYLAALSVDTLKIDRTFIQGLAAGEAGRAITDAVTHLAHSLGMRAVAEGVETRQEVLALRELGCDAMQGFLVGPPVEAEAITALVAAR